MHTHSETKNICGKNRKTPFCYANLKYIKNKNVQSILPRVAFLFSPYTFVYTSSQIALLLFVRNEEKKN